MLQGSALRPPKTHRADRRLALTLERKTLHGVCSGCKYRRIMCRGSTESTMPGCVRASSRGEPNRNETNEVQVGMRPVQSERLMRWLAGPLMVVLALSLVASGSARAGCSHPVTSEFDRRVAAFDRLDDLITGGLSVMAAASIPGRAPSDRPQPRRCEGPGCSGSVPRPGPASSATPVTYGLDQWIALAQTLDDASLLSNRLVPEQAPACPAGHAPSVFHPPDE